MTRHQVRAARILLRLTQDALAEKANMGVATLRRYEGGQEISALRMKALREAIEAAGAVLIAEVDGSGSKATGIGVKLLPSDRLPDETRNRIAEVDASDLPATGGGETEGQGGPVEKRGRGRPRRKADVPRDA